MLTSARYLNGGGGGGGAGGGGSIYTKNSLSSYSPSLSINNSRATSQESDLYSFASSITTTTTDRQYQHHLLRNDIQKCVSPLRSNSSTRCSSVVRTVANMKYPISVYKKSKAYKKLNADNSDGGGDELAIAAADAISSSQLSIKIAEFLQRTDHVTTEWKKIGKEEKKKQYASIGKKIDDYFKSVKMYQTKKEADVDEDVVNGICNVGRRPAVAEPENVDGKLADNSCIRNKLSEMTVDLAEEHSAANLASERLELETSERIRLENEVSHLHTQNKKLQESSEKLETELLCMKTAEANGIMGIEDDDSLATADDNASNNGGAVYKQRYERVLRELEYTKRRLQQQHHDDLEQLIALRKQLEKKIADAYEEVEEQRQVVAQWKRKVQKLNGEMSDLRLMLEDSNSRNNLLEKKQRKFDSELLLLQDELRQEKQNRERISREKEMALADKYTLEQNLSALKVDLELKEQKLTNLNRELQEISYGGNTEEEIAKLRKAKHDLENKVAEQEEELDDLTGQVNLLEQAKVRLEMNFEQLRKEHKKEISQRDDENEKVRCNTTKKVKALECQLENEHDERTMLLRERHDLERKLAEIEDRERCNRSADQETVNKLRRDLKKTKILLHDAQLMLQQAKLDAPNKAMLRQLRNQLEDAEYARNTALKARQMLETDLAELTTTLEEVQKAKSDAEEKAALYAREKTQLQSQLDENEEELAEVLKKYRNTVQQLTNEQLTLQEQASRIAELESERSSLRDQLAEVTSRLENIETHGDPTSSLAVKRLELKTKELESKLDLEQTTRSRMEVQIGRLKEAAERLQHDADIARNKEASAQETVRKLQRALREAREVQSNYESKESTEAARKRELEKKLEQAEMELSSTKADLKLALQRVDDLQYAIQGDLEDNEDDQSESDNDDSGSSNASLQSFLTQTNGRISIDKWLNNGPGSSDNSKT